MTPATSRNEGWIPTWALLMVLGAGVLGTFTAAAWLGVLVWRHV